MAEQLKLTGHPLFEPTPFERCMDDMMRGIIVDIRRDINRADLFFDRDPNWRPAFEVLTLVEPAPKCCTTRDLGEESLDCDLDNGHDGQHYDAHLRLDWSSR